MQSPTLSSSNLLLGVVNDSKHWLHTINNLLAQCLVHESECGRIVKSYRQVDYAIPTYLVNLYFDTTFYVKCESFFNFNPIIHLPQQTPFGVFSRTVDRFNLAHEMPYVVY